MAINRNAYPLIALPHFPEFAQAVRYGVPGTLGVFPSLLWRRPREAGLIRPRTDRIKLSLYGASAVGNKGEPVDGKSTGWVQTADGSGGGCWRARASTWRSASSPVAARVLGSRLNRAAKSTPSTRSTVAQSAAKSAGSGGSPGAKEARWRERAWK